MIMNLPTRLLCRSLVRGGAAEWWSVTPRIEDPSSKANRANLQQKNPMLIEFQHRSSSFLPPRFFEAGLDSFGGMTVILLGDASRL